MKGLPYIPVYVCVRVTPIMLECFIILHRAPETWERTDADGRTDMDIFRFVRVRPGPLQPTGTDKSGRVGVLGGGGENSGSETARIHDPILPPALGRAPSIPLRARQAAFEPVRSPRGPLAWSGPQPRNVAAPNRPPWRSLAPCHGYGGGNSGASPPNKAPDILSCAVWLSFSIISKR